MKKHELVRNYIKRNQERYLDSSKDKKTVMVTETCLSFNLSRKHIIKLFNDDENQLKQKAGRKATYSGDLVHHLYVLWDSMERICAKRMKEALQLWIPFYKDPSFNLILRDQILKMSTSSIERYLKRGRKTLKGLSGTKRAKFFKYKIPVNDFSQSIVNAGHVAADTVAHCGDKLSGEFVWSLTVTDRLSGWTENAALFTKNQHQIRKAMRRIEDHFPFPLLSIQTDCGTEFLNYEVFTHFHNRPKPIIMTRSRPYKKNDNAHVEQKNFTHVRSIFGYERLDNQEIVKLMDEIYRDYWNPLHNFFLPQMKIESKERIGSSIKKKYSKAITPYERVKLSPNVSDEDKRKLEIQFKSLNPFELKNELESKLKLFFQLTKNQATERKAA